jgi:hypothetical protein
MEIKSMEVRNIGKGTDRHKLTGDTSTPWANETKYATPRGLMGLKSPWPLMTPDS